MNAINLMMIRSSYSALELEEFEKELSEDNISEYQMVQKKGFCGCCKNIEAVACLTYVIKDGRTREICMNCPECHSPLEFNFKTKFCPKCNTLMERKEIGEWD